MVKAEVEAAVPEVPAVPGTPGLKRAVDAAFADDGPLARAVDQFEPRAGQRAMARAVADMLERRRRPARRGRHRHRQDAGLSGAGDPERPARADLHRHQEPAGADLLQGHPGAAHGARRAVHRDLHEGPRELSVPAPARSAARAAGRRRWTSSRRSTSGGATTDTGDRAELERPAGRLVAVARRLGHGRDLPRQRLPAVPASASSRGCASAPPNRTS